MNEILLPLAATAVNVVAHVLAFRLRHGTRFFRSVVEGFLAGAAAFVILEVALFPGRDSLKDYLIIAFLVNAPIYLALSYCTYNFVQLGQTSIRIRMYSEIASKPSGVSIQEISREYDDRALLQARLRRLIESGDIVEREGRYFVGRRRFLHISHILIAVKRFLLGRESEFE